MLTFSQTYRIEKLQYIPVGIHRYLYIKQNLLSQNMWISAVQSLSQWNPRDSHITDLQEKRSPSNCILRWKISASQWFKIWLSFFINNQWKATEVILQNLPLFYKSCVVALKTLSTLRYSYHLLTDEEVRNNDQV